MSEEPEVLFEKRGGLGIITLNRPKALNALNQPMVLEIHPKMVEWAADDEVQAVLIVGTGEKAFCAGGDILWLRNNGLENRPRALSFYWDEYRLNRYIKHYPKPYIAFIDGITMGGGCGLSVHGDFRVATERTMYAMPETGIGLFPDVGGSFFMPRCPGETGMFSALTGDRLKAGDSLHLGIANSYTPSARLPELQKALEEGDLKDAETVKGILQDFHEDPGTSHVKLLEGQIDVVFREDSVEAIQEALKLNGSDFALKTLDTLSKKSPTSLKLTFQQMRRGAQLDFDDCMRMEYRMVTRTMDGHDFYEGVRAVIVDKDNAPKWRPDTLAAVSDAEIDAYFEPLGDRDLHFDGAPGTRVD
ncbi:MAG: enoyl-CoA hydratase/isomerase family protein [Alphaproteobacteria bacterium]|nr:enoyl-CoA hydratase/isomerase family protein [Alphaproteobacteria bacterium]